MTISHKHALTIERPVNVTIIIVFLYTKPFKTDVVVIRYSQSADTTLRDCLPIIHTREPSCLLALDQHARVR